MAIMFGNGSVQEYNTADGNIAYIMKTEQFTATANAAGSSPTDAGWSDKYKGPDGKLYPKVNAKFYSADSTVIDSFVTGKTYFCSYDLKINGAIIEISANSFPGTYYVTGDTYARAEATGDDEFFQFIIPKAKVQSENTLTLEAEGDPSVFNMNLKVLRPADGVMMKLVKYELADVGTDPTAADVGLYHNHSLDPASALGQYTTRMGTHLYIDNPAAAGANTITWASTDDEVATVSVGTSTHAGQGDVTPVAVGTATIIATWDGSSANDGGYATYNVTILAAS